MKIITCKNKYYGKKLPMKSIIWNLYLILYLLVKIITWSRFPLCCVESNQISREKQTTGSEPEKILKCKQLVAPSMLLITFNFSHYLWLIRRNEMAALDDVDSISDFVNCHVCRCEYDADVRKPKFLPCSHTVCILCLRVSLLLKCIPLIN